MKLTLTGFSTALYSTWYFLEEYGVLFDAGDGVTASLLQKSGKIKHVFITHPDRDHLTGLFQLNQLNARAGRPVIYYPEDSGSFPALKAFTTKFDPHVSGAEWQPLLSGATIGLNKELVVTSIRNNHINAPENVTKSLSYYLLRVRRKLKPEFKHLAGTEIRDLIAEKGSYFVTNEVRENVVSYSGDTPVEDYERWEGSNILIHEATFLEGEQNPEINRHGNKHSTLTEVMEMVANIKINQLILGHFSPRYSADQINTAIRKEIKKYNVKIPVHCIYPGKTSRDILAQDPINA